MEEDCGHLLCLHLNNDNDTIARPLHSSSDQNIFNISATRTKSLLQFFCTKRLHEKEEKAIASIKKEPIQVDQFLQKLRRKKLDKYLNFEVQAIVRNQEEYPCTIALHPDNIDRNLTTDVISYDHSLVKLEIIPPGCDSDYINASYIEGYNNEKEYIATQGPRVKSMAAFWHMVWQENVHCIVMATGLFDNSVLQCNKYWGDAFTGQKYVLHGDIHIYLKDTLELAKFVIRTFQISQDGCNSSRIVKHFEMIGFTDVATDPGFLLDVRRWVNKFMLTVPGPLLVHCRCGGGRTAVFIAIDMCLKQLERDNFVDIYSTVLHLQKFRKNMVRSLAEYRLIYDTLAMYVQVWTTVIPCSQLPAVAQQLLLKDPETDKTGYEREFQFLQDIVPKIQNGDCASGHREENRNKSRDIMLLPPERSRPYLQTIETGEFSTDFINAVFIDGYHQNGSFIVTQWPMHNTMKDIWRLLYDLKMNTLIVMHENSFSQSVQCFWPKVLDLEVKYGPIGVKYLGCQKYQHIIIRAFAIRKRASGLPLIDLLTQSMDWIIVKMFQYTSWHQKDKVPVSTKSFLYMMSCVDEWQKSMQTQRPACIMSKDGFSKCGIYCTLGICCDQLCCEHEVDIFNVVRIVKRNRPQLIPSLAEYIYCYTYLSLMVHLMQEDSLKIKIASPKVIEGEILQGYELVTGFENIFAPEPDINPHHLHTGSFHTDCSSDSKHSSSDGMNMHGLDFHNCSLRDKSHKKHSANNVKGNGHISGNGHKKLHTPAAQVTPPAAPGQMYSWSPYSSEDNHSDCSECRMSKCSSTSKQFMYRQNSLLSSSLHSQLHNHSGPGNE